MFCFISANFAEISWRTKMKWNSVSTHTHTLHESPHTPTYTCPPNHLPTSSPIHPLAHSPTDPHTHSFTRSTHPLTHLIYHTQTHALTHFHSTHPPSKPTHYPHSLTNTPLLFTLTHTAFLMYSHFPLTPSLRPMSPTACLKILLG
jgi:hypothetical protein